MPADPFVFDDVPAPARRLIEWLIDMRSFRRLRVQVEARRDEPFERAVLGALDVVPAVSPDDLALVPRTGPFVAVANHPHGALDGLLLVDILRDTRADVRLLANFLLARIPEMRDRCFFVDPFGGPRAARRSHAGLRAADRWLRHGGALVVFPAGEVAHRRRGGRAIDSEWTSTAARLAVAAGSPVLPIWIEGSNSRLFHAAGLLHPALRTALLGRELLNKRGRRIAVRIGPLRGVVDVPTTVSIRHSVDILSDPIAAEVSRLPASSRMAAGGAFDVFCAEAARIPETLREIGRLREQTYRAIGEGTGRALDIDAFDGHYLHLFAWDRDRRRVAGAYRIGRTDEILASRGVDGLYTRTLFRYDGRFLTRLGTPALELGRSWVRAEYQKNYHALLQLWRGIGAFVVRHPQYRLLFGPVSISARYSDTSHRLLTEFLRQNHLDRDLAALVDAIHPVRRSPQVHPWSGAASIADVDRLVAHVESDGKGVPVLLRQYLKLNARVLGFNIDPEFGDALDALMLVDLTTVDRAVLARYLGSDGAVQFLAFHPDVSRRAVA